MYYNLLKQLPYFCKNVLEYWLNLEPWVQDHLSSTQLLWNNEIFKNRGTVLYVDRWVKNGITYTAIQNNLYTQKL